MSWMDRLESEQAAQREQAAAQAQRDQIAREAAASCWTATNLSAVIHAEVARIAARVGVKLMITDRDSGIEVRAPRLREHIYGPHIGHDRLEIWGADESASTVKVRLINDKRIDRPWENQPDNMTPEEYIGPQRTLIFETVRVDAFRDADIHPLLEWLVRTALGQSVQTPTLSGIVPQHSASASGCTTALAIVLLLSVIISLIF